MPSSLMGAEGGQGGGLRVGGGAGLALDGKHEALADFISSCLARYAMAYPNSLLGKYPNNGKQKLSLLLGEGAAFYDEYRVSTGSANLRKEQRTLAVYGLLGDAAASYIVEDIGWVSRRVGGGRSSRADSHVDCGSCGAERRHIPSAGPATADVVPAGQDDKAASPDADSMLLGLYGDFAQGLYAAPPTAAAPTATAPSEAASPGADSMLLRLYGDFAHGLYAAPPEASAKPAMTNTKPTAANTAPGGAARDGLIARAICGTRREFLSGLVKSLRKRGCGVEYATSSKAASLTPAASGDRLPDFTRGGRDRRRHERIAVALMVCSVIIVAALSLLQPIRVWTMEASARAARDEAAVGADAAYYAQLYGHRQVQAELPAYRALAAALDGAKTGYGDLLESLGAGALKGAAVDEIALGDDGGIIVSLRTKNIAALESGLEALNNSRMMSAAEIGKRERVGNKKNREWKTQVKISYYSFGGAAQGGEAANQ
jgi:hypothetical protein